MNIPDVNLPRVVVIGAGFAGLKLSRNINTNFYQLVLIDKNNFHTFQPLLYQVASAGLEPDSIAYPIRKYWGVKKTHFSDWQKFKEYNPMKKLFQQILVI